MNGCRTPKSASQRNNRNDNQLASQLSFFAWDCNMLDVSWSGDCVAEKLLKQRNDPLLNELHSPKSRLRKSLEVGREAVSLLHELGDIKLDETSLHVDQLGVFAMGSPRNSIVTCTSAHSTVVERVSKFRTPMRSAVNASVAQTPVTHPVNDSNDSSLHSDSPVAVNSPLSTSTPTSAALRYKQNSVKCLVNNSMDDSDFDFIISDTAASFSKPKEMKPSNFWHKQLLREKKPLNDSMDDPDTNFLIANSCIEAPMAPRLSVTVSTAATTNGDDDDITIIEPMTSASGGHVEPVRIVLTPKLRRHGSHDVSSSPTSSHPGQTAESARRMRRHRSLIDELRACDVTPITTTASRAAVNEPPSRPSPAFNSTLVKPSTLQRYMNKPMQQTLPGGPKSAIVNGGAKYNNVSVAKENHDEKWLSSRKSPVNSLVNASVHAPKNHENHLAAIQNKPVVLGRKRPNFDLMCNIASSRSTGQPPILSPKRPPPQHTNKDVISNRYSISNKPVLAITTTDGFISKKLVSQIVSTQKYFTSNNASIPSASATSTYVPPKNDSFYDDDIEFPEVVISS